ncbi:MAG: DUF433 domain-containing protein [Rhodospirillaceae bacterium]
MSSSARQIASPCQGRRGSPGRCQTRAPILPPPDPAGGTGRGDATEAPGFPAGSYWPIESESLNPLREGTVESTRITADPRQSGGVPCIRRLRIRVATVVGVVAHPRLRGRRRYFAGSAGVIRRLRYATAPWSPCR